MAARDALQSGHKNYKFMDITDLPEEEQAAIFAEMGIDKLGYILRLRQMRRETPDFQEKPQPNFDKKTRDAPGLAIAE